MIATTLSGGRSLVLNPASLSLLLVGTAISAVAAFDIVFNAVTLGLPWLRAIVFATLTATGLFCANRVGLRLQFHGLRHPITTSFALGALIALAIWLIDTVVFRPILPPAYVALFAEHNTGERILYFMLRAFNEQILYRLFLMSVLVWCMGRVLRNTRGPVSSPIFWTAIVLAQAIPMILNEIPNYPPHITPVFMLYVAVRFILAGVLYGYLYWRHGFSTAEISHVSTHLFLQPLLGLSLA